MVRHSPSRSRLRATTSTSKTVTTFCFAVLSLILVIVAWTLAVADYDHHGNEASISFASSTDHHHHQPWTSSSVDGDHRRLNNDTTTSTSNDDPTSTAEAISVNVTFGDILKTVVFLLSTWAAANVCQVIGLPSLAGEIIAGVVLGPPVLDFCPYPEAMVLIGNFGLIGLILNSGIDLDIAQLRETGTRAVMIALSGTVLALSTGIGVSYLVASSSIQSAFSIGAVFAPSSWGVASQVLGKGEVLNTPTGQTIMASSVVDDILGLILLSILEVFVMDNPSVFDYIKPFLASFGYLIVLGGLGITVIPRVVQKYVLPRFPEEKQDWAAIALMFCLMTAYLPLMFYSGASFLTGAFLAGVSFSQLHHVHATFAQSSREVMVWLMRIFFAATIGFQVPAVYFKEPLVLRKGAIFLIPIIAKFPLGFLIPRFHREIPADFPYNPYWRDVWITSLSMLCRGEFNFVVASVALQAGLLSAEQYAGTVFAVLMSSMVVPLILARVIARYNKMSLKYLDASHPITRIGKTGDGYRPLFLAIQARTPVHWGMHDKLQHALETAGLLIIDHRSWHTLGMDAVNVTEIFCQDKEIQVKIKGCFGQDRTTESIRSQARRTDNSAARVSGRLSKTPTPLSLAETFASSEGQTETGPDEDFMALVADRKEEIREHIATSLGLDPDQYAIQVSEWEWETFALEPDAERAAGGDGDEAKKGYCFHSSIQPNEVKEDMPDEDVPQTVDIKSPIPKAFLRRSKSNASASEETKGNTIRASFRRATSTASEADSTHHHAEDPHLATRDLWETDDECHHLAREGYFQTPNRDGSTIVHVAEGCTGGPVGNRPRADSARRAALASPAANTPRLPSRPPRLPQRSTTFAEGCTGGPVGNCPRADSAHRAALASPAANSPSRPPRLHQRSITFDASQLDNFNHDVETYTIKDRLHGYVRP